jgi:hypothetical protein
MTIESRTADRRLRIAVCAIVAAGTIGSGNAAGQRSWIHINHPLAGNHGGEYVWMVRASDHFEIYYQRDHERSLDAIVLEAERAYASVSFDLKYEVAEKVPLILLQAERHLPRDVERATALVRESGAPDRHHLLLTLDPVDDRSTRVVHELTHVFAFEILPPSSGAPRWAQEALAEHQAGAWSASDLATLRAAAGTGAIPSVAAFADTDRLWGRALFEFVADEYGARGLRGYLDALRSSPATPVAALGMSAGDFDAAFKAYVAARFLR